MQKGACPHFASEADMDETRRLAEFCAGVWFDKLPPEVVSKAKLCLLDYLANVYGSLELEAVCGIVSYMKTMGDGGPSTALACAWLRTLLSASCKMRKINNSIASGRRPSWGSRSRCTATSARADQS